MHAALDLARRTAEGFLMFVARPQSTLCMSRDVKHNAIVHEPWRSQMTPCAWLVPQVRARSPLLRSTLYPPKR